MIIVFLTPSDLQEVVPRLLERHELNLSPIRGEGTVQYLLPNGVLLMQSGAGITLTDDNWSGALYILRELAALAKGQVSFMTDEDELRIGILRNDAPTPADLLAEFHVHTGPDLPRFAADIARMMEVADEEMEPDLYTSAHTWAMDNAPEALTSADQLSDYQITIVVPAPGLVSKTPLAAQALTDQRWFQDADEKVFVATGPGYFLLLDDITQDRGATFARGTLNVFFDPDVTFDPDREAVLDLVRGLSSETLPFIQIDVDRNAETADESGFWVEEITWRDGAVHQSNFFWQL